MTPVQAALLFIAAALGGALNSVAGGGSFLTFPMLLFTGVAPITGNATSTVALWPGAVASVGAHRDELAHVPHVALFSAVSLVGGILGALLLLHTPQAIFSGAIPYLLLAATLLFAFSARLTALLRRWRSERGAGGAAGALAPGAGTVPASPRTLASAATAQLVIATYGGYFGGGIGILMLATLGLMGMQNLHQMNALKTVLASVINGVAVLLFVLGGIVAWPQAIVMLAGGVLGGYTGARYALRLDPAVVRRVVVVVGSALSAYFFLFRR